MERKVRTVAFFPLTSREHRLLMRRIPDVPPPEQYSEPCPITDDRKPTVKKLKDNKQNWPPINPKDFEKLNKELKDSAENKPKRSLWDYVFPRKSETKTLSTRSPVRSCSLRLTFCRLSIRGDTNRRKSHLARVKSASTGIQGKGRSCGIESA